MLTRRTVSCRTAGGEKPKKRDPVPLTHAIGIATELACQCVIGSRSASGVTWCSSAVSFSCGSLFTNCRIRSAARVVARLCVRPVLWVANSRWSCAPSPQPTLAVAWRLPCSPPRRYYAHGSCLVQPHAFPLSATCPAATTRRPPRSRYDVRTARRRDGVQLSHHNDPSRVAFVGISTPQ